MSTTRLVRLFARLGLVAAAAAATLTAPSLAQAHFRLISPEANLEQDGLGDPQKVAPCGDNGTGVPTGIVTELEAGSTVTITIDETIMHPGHYRVAIAETPDGLPADPIVTPGATACGSTEIMDPPVFPVLADGLFLHDTAFTEPQTIEVALPADFTCDNCTLQVIQFMSSHGAPCFYYHCAAVTISGGAATAGDTGGEGTAGTDPTDPTDPTGVPGSSDGGDSSEGGSATASGGEESGDTTAAGSGVTNVTATATSGDVDDQEGDGGCGCNSERPMGSAALGLVVVAMMRRRSRAAK